MGIKPASTLFTTVFFNDRWGTADTPWSIPKGYANNVFGDPNRAEDTARTFQASVLPKLFGNIICDDRKCPDGSRAPTEGHLIMCTCKQIYGAGALKPGSADVIPDMGR